MSFLRRLLATLCSGRVDSELNDELDFHLDRCAQDLRAQGLSPAEARREAIRRFGNRARVQESTREPDLLVWPQDFLRNIRFATRAMRRNPSFAVAAVLSLALGIGANTALFSVLDGLLLR